MDRKAGPRTVGLSHRVAKALAEQAADKEPHEPIFTLGYHGLGKTWRVVRDRAGLSDLRIKDLRHVFAGLGLDADGVSLAALKGGLRHARLETTMRYADRDMAFDSKHAALIEDLVFGAAVNG